MVILGTHQVKIFVVLKFMQIAGYVIPTLVMDFITKRLDATLFLMEAINGR